MESILKRKNKTKNVDLFVEEVFMNYIRQFEGLNGLKRSTTSLQTRNGRIVYQALRNRGDKPIFGNPVICFTHNRYAEDLLGFRLEHTGGGHDVKKEEWVNIWTPLLQTANAMCKSLGLPDTIHFGDGKSFYVPCEYNPSSFRIVNDQMNIMSKLCRVFGELESFDNSFSQD